jgi:hypothetical protein
MLIMHGLPALPCMSALYSNMPFLNREEDTAAWPLGPVYILLATKLC